MIPLLFSPLGRVLATLAIAAIAWFGWLHNHDKKVMSRVVAKIEQKATDNADKANAARRTADDLPVDRLRDKFFRD